MKTTVLWLVGIAAVIGFSCGAGDFVSGRMAKSKPPAGSSVTLNIQDSDRNNIADPLDALIVAQLTGDSYPPPFSVC